MSGGRFSNSASRRSCPPKSDASAFISVVRPLPQRLPSSTLRDDSWVKTRSPNPSKTALGTERGVSARKGGPRDNFFSIRGKAHGRLHTPPHSLHALTSLLLLNLNPLRKVELAAVEIRTQFITETSEAELGAESRMCTQMSLLTLSNL